MSARTSSVFSQTSISSFGNAAEARRLIRVGRLNHLNGRIETLQRKLDGLVLARMDLLKEAETEAFANPNDPFYRDGYDRALDAAERRADGDGVEDGQAGLSPLANLSEVLAAEDQQFDEAFGK